MSAILKLLGFGTKSAAITTEDNKKGKVIVLYKGIKVVEVEPANDNYNKYYDIFIYNIGNGDNNYSIASGHLAKNSGGIGINVNRPLPDNLSDDQRKILRCALLKLLGTSAAEHESGLITESSIKQFGTPHLWKNGDGDTDCHWAEASGGAPQFNVIGAIQILIAVVILCLIVWYLTKLFAPEVHQQLVDMVGKLLDLVHINMW